MAKKSTGLPDRITKAKDVEGAGGLEQVQEKMDEDLERGYRGMDVDPNPNELYSQETDPTKSPGVTRAVRLEQDQFMDPADPNYANQLAQRGKGDPETPGGTPADKKE